MQISANFARILMNDLHNFSGPNIPANNGLIGASEVVKSFLTIPKDSSLLPVLAMGVIRSRGFFYTKESKLTTSTDIIIPLYVGSQESRRTTDSILKSLILTPRSCRLTKVTTSSGEVFYGGQGVILEEDGTPILLTKIQYNSSSAACRIKDGTVFVSPKVFSMDNVVYKGILSKILPVYMGLVDNTTSIKLKVSIEDIQGFSKPQLINNSIRMSCEAANKFLRDHINYALP